MSRLLAPLRGMNDVLPEDSHWWQFVETAAFRVFAAYGYQEIRIPLLERTELFRRSIGEVTDIVEKEMYTFDDRNGDSVTLRPEATAGVVRAALSNGLLHNQQQKLWCCGPMFRHERPQKGRYRQFHQIDVEALGYPGPDVDAEVILMSARLLRELGLTDVKLTLNSLGTPQARATYRDVLVEYFQAHEAVLDEDSRRRLTTNPLRILDTKNPDLAELVREAPSLADHLDDESRAHFDTLRETLAAAGIEHEVNPRLVRGLDYYSRTVFEWLTDRLGAQSAVCSGGRYDGLIEQLGGRPTPAIGWAAGMERLVELVRLRHGERTAAAADLYVLTAQPELETQALLLAEHLRDEFPVLRIQAHSGGGGLKSQMRRADRSGAQFAVLLGGDEWARREVVVKPLRGEDEQRAVPRESLASWLRERWLDAA